MLDRVFFAYMQVCLYNKICLSKYFYVNVNYLLMNKARRMYKAFRKCLVYLLLRTEAIQTI